MKNIEWLWQWRRWAAVISGFTALVIFANHPYWALSLLTAAFCFAESNGISKNSRVSGEGAPHGD